MKPFAFGGIGREMVKPFGGIGREMVNWVVVRLIPYLSVQYQR